MVNFSNFLKAFTLKAFIPEGKQGKAAWVYTWKECKALYFWGFYSEGKQDKATWAYTWKGL